MEFTWTTFILELINFIVLIWILNRLLYKPVMKALFKRKQAIQQEMDVATNLKKEAQELESKYQSRLQDWQKEVEKRRRGLEKDLVVIKEKEMADLKIQLAKDQAKQKAVEESRLRKQQVELTKESMSIATRFVSKFLAKLADKHLEEKIISILITDLSSMTKEQRESLCAQYVKQAEIPIKVESSYSLTIKQKEQIEIELRTIWNKKLSLDFKKNPKLLAGLNISVGSFVIQASLQDELKFFGEVAHGSFQT